MPDPDQDATRAWVETWAKAGPKLEEIRRRELAAMTYEDRIRAIHSLLQLANRAGPKRVTSGLVEQQRLFRKGRK